MQIVIRNLLYLSLALRLQGEPQTVCRRGDAHQCEVERPQRSDASKPYSSKPVFLDNFYFHGLKMHISGRSAFRKTYIEWSSLKVASAGAIDKLTDLNNNSP